MISTSDNTSWELFLQLDIILIQEIVLAVHAGISAEQLIQTIHPHPTLSEAVKEAVTGVLGTSVNI